MLGGPACGQRDALRPPPTLWRHTSDIVNTRAIVSVAWIAGPPLATLIIGTFGNRAILLAIGAIAVLTVATTAVMISQRSTATDHDGSAKRAEDDHLALRKRAVALIVAAFVLLQAANPRTSILTLYLTERCASTCLGRHRLRRRAGLEVPALILIGRLSLRFSSLRLVTTGCVAGIAYYVAMAYVTGPVMLIALQPLNAWCFAAIAGVGLTLFQQMIPRPGLSTGLYMNTRRVGAVSGGPDRSSLASTTSLEPWLLRLRVLIVLALVVHRSGGSTEAPRPTADLPPSCRSHASLRGTHRRTIPTADTRHYSPGQARLAVVSLSALFGIHHSSTGSRSA